MLEDIAFKICNWTYFVGETVSCPQFIGTFITHPIFLIPIKDHLFINNLSPLDLEYGHGHFDDLSSFRKSTYLAFPYLMCPKKKYSSLLFILGFGRI
jgi:hypothetical protein